MKKVKLHWLDGRAKGGYVTFGVPWKKDECADKYFLCGKDGERIAFEEKPIAFYPDGSTKWSSYTAKIDGTDTVELRNEDVISDKSCALNSNSVTDGGSEFIVDNGAFKTVFPTRRSSDL